MSRVGKNPVAIADGVSMKQDGDIITVSGSKGEVSFHTFSVITVKEEDGAYLVERANDEKQTKAKHGLIRAQLANAVTGVTKGFEKKLEVNGVGFKVALQANKLVMSLGFSHPVEFELPEGVSAAVEGNFITVTGVDKQKVGMVASDIRALKKPEPYKGKGIKYVDEHIVRKAGKAAGA